MITEGHLDKMITNITDNVVHYQLPVDNDHINLNDLIGKTIKLSYSGKIHCMHCGKQTKTSFGQGYCYNCYTTIPEADECILFPEKCKAHLGISRDMEWSKNHCLTDHIVYLAYSGNLKVGVTRLTQVPTRWIDQGAIQSIQLALTPNRHIAGLIEVYYKQHFSDKTSWQQMLLTDKKNDLDLNSEKKRAVDLMPAGLKKYIHENNNIFEFHYPMTKKPQNITSVNFNKSDKIGGKLTGIKGQYLVFDNEFVINMRSHRGYLVKIEY